jgi:CBS domain containing-hemolysin-like protein
VNIPLLAVMLGLLVFSGLFSGSEAALFSLSKLQIHRMRERHDRASRRILALLKDPDQTLSTLLVGNNLVNIGLSSVTTAFFLTLLADRSRAVEVSALTVTLVVLLFGEITPKTLAVNYALGTSRLLSGGLPACRNLLNPPTRLVHGLAKLMLRAAGREAETTAPGGLISRSELHALLEDVDDEVSIMTRHERGMVQNILDFSRRTAEQIMTPRVDIDDLDLSQPSSEIVRFMRESRHSRYPVFEDDPDNIVGFVQSKEYLINPDREVRELLRPVVFFPSSAPVDGIFAAIQRSRTGMVIVVNEYGETVGLITREDVVEEIVGDIYDEFDLEEAPIRKRGEGLYIVHGRSDLSDLNEELALELPDESAVTLNGFLCEVHGRIPRPGTVVAWKELRFHILEVARHQVRKVLVEIPQDREGGAS